MRTLQRPNRHPHHPGFTLVEMLVVITVIGVLMALVVPAIGGAIKKAKATRIKVEVNQLGLAISDYKNKYGDYPPDFSDAAIVTRHYNKVFPKLSDVDKGLLTSLAANGSSVFTGTEIDRAEALVLVLGGFSNDPVNPFTRPGGPFEIVDT